jgi:hypothetical protein
MPRRRKYRQIGFAPVVTYFKPRGIPLSSLQEVELTLDEIEAIRLVEVEDLDQIHSAQKMTISQSTLQRILAQAHKKIAQALIYGQAIKIKGGEVIMPRGRINGGRGRMGGTYAAGPGGFCVCTNPDCQEKVPHQTGVPCYQLKCPKCGSPMTRKS